MSRNKACNYKLTKFVRTIFLATFTANRQGGSAHVNFNLILVEYLFFVAFKERIILIMNI